MLLIFRPWWERVVEIYNKQDKSSWCSGTYEKYTSVTHKFMHVTLIDLKNIFYNIKTNVLFVVHLILWNFSKRNSGIGWAGNKICRFLACSEKKMDGTRRNGVYMKFKFFCYHKVIVLLDQVHWVKGQFLENEKKTEALSNKRNCVKAGWQQN